MGHVLAHRDEPAVKAAVGKGIEKVLEQRLIADLDRTKQNRKTRPGHPVALQVFGAFSALARNEGLVAVDQMSLFGLRDEFLRKDPFPFFTVFGLERQSQFTVSIQRGSFSSFPSTQVPAAQGGLGFGPWAFPNPSPFSSARRP